jgi:hypothetical protein
MGPTALGGEGNSAPGCVLWSPAPGSGRRRGHHTDAGEHSKDGRCACQREERQVRMRDCAVVVIGHRLSARPGNLVPTGRPAQRAPQQTFDQEPGFVQQQILQIRLTAVDDREEREAMCSTPARLRMRAASSTKACITQPTSITQQSASSTDRARRRRHSGIAATGSTAPIKMIAAPAAFISRHWLSRWPPGT